jgi:hypothetical protein
MAKLIPPDRDQCQCEKPNGVNFLTFGGKPGLVRCKNKPIVILKETKPGQDGLKGSMSLCEGCLEVFKKDRDIDEYDVVTLRKKKVAKS